MTPEPLSWLRGMARSGDLEGIVAAGLRGRAPFRVDAVADLLRAVENDEEIAVAIMKGALRELAGGDDGR